MACAVEVLSEHADITNRAAGWHETCSLRYEENAFDSATQLLRDWSGFKAGLRPGRRQDLAAGGHYGKSLPSS
jgi:hypothetical protein